VEHVPLVSIVIPTYNYSHFICEAIDSVLASNFSSHNLEIIVIDDGSTDDTANKINLYKGRIKYISQNNSGKAWATKIGIEEARGKYIFNLDADDIFLPDKLQKVIDIFEQDEDIVHVAYPALCRNETHNIEKIEPIPKFILDKKILGKELLLYFYKRGILFGGGSTFSARSSVLKNIFIPKEVDMFIDEYLILATLTQGYSFFLSQPLSVWRIHDKNFSQQRRSNSSREKLKRNFESIKAVSKNLSWMDLEPKMTILYQLKTKGLMLKIKEELEEKSISDIFDLWRFIFTHITTFGVEIFEIIKNYHIFNRTLPTFFLGFIRGIKTRLGE